MMGRQKIFKKIEDSLPWFIMENYSKTKRKVFKTKFRLESQLCVEKVLASYNVCP